MKALGARNVAILAESSVFEGSLVRNRRFLATALSCRRRARFGTYGCGVVAVTGGRISCCAASPRLRNLFLVTAARDVDAELQESSLLHARESSRW